MPHAELATSCRMNTCGCRSCRRSAPAPDAGGYITGPRPGDGGPGNEPFTLTCFSIGAAWVPGGGTEAPSARSDTTIKEKQMQLYPEFPTCRADTPKRQAEKQMYKAFEACDFDGRVLYEAKPLSTAPQIDFAVWIVGVGIFGIQVKGGRYILVEGQWFLITDHGRFLRESPVPSTWDAAMAIRDVVQEQLHQSIFVIPVLAMPNMEPNQDIEALAGSRNVAMHWGDPDQLVDHLVQLAIDRKVHITPTPASIAAQVQLVEPGLVLPRQAPAGLEAPQQLHIHVEHLHIHIPQGLSELQGTRTSTQQPPVDLFEDGGQETGGAVCNIIHSRGTSSIQGCRKASPRSRFLP